MVLLLVTVFTFLGKMPKRRRTDWLLDLRLEMYQLLTLLSYTESKIFSIFSSFLARCPNLDIPEIWLSDTF